MKRSSSSKILTIGVFTLKLVLIPLTLFTLAQINPHLDRPTLESVPLQETEVEHNLNVGLVGLLGLLGLAGAEAKKRKKSVNRLRTDEENYFG